MKLHARRFFVMLNSGEMEQFQQARKNCLEFLSLRKRENSVETLIKEKTLEELASRVVSQWAECSPAPAKRAKKKRRAPEAKLEIVVRSWLPGFLSQSKLCSSSG